jgi:hypothetical protein
MNALTSKIEQFFHVFIDGFKTNNINQLQACYHFPCTLNTPEHIDIIINKEQLAVYLDAIFVQLENEQFSQLQISNAHYTLMNNELILASIDWVFVDDAGDVFSHFSAFYHLACKNNQLFIINAVSHDIKNSQKLMVPFHL